MLEQIQQEAYNQATGDLQSAADAYMDAVLVEARTKAGVRDAQGIVDAAVDEYMAGQYAMAQAKDPDCPLTGLAVTSDAYKVTARNLQRQFLQSNGMVDRVMDLDRAIMAHEEAGAVLEITRAQFSASRHGADLMAAILRSFGS